MKVHSKAIGIEPLSGNRYDVNDPHSQLWIHLTAWHSILYAYERYGPGRLSAQDEASYWADCVTAAELQTCDPADVPTTREGIREYFEMMRPRLAGSEAAQSMMDFLLNGEVMFPLAILGLMSPSTRKVMAPIFLDVPPERPETLTPPQARERYGYNKPSEAHLEWRERQQARLLVGDAPSDDGLVESEPLLGAMA